MFFSGLFQRKSDAPVTTPAELADAIGLSYDTYTGKQISSQRAMRLTAVFSCVRVLAESVGMLPCNLYHLNGSLKQRATGERLHKLLSTHPNGYMTPQEFWELVVTCLCLRGNFYAYKVKAFGEVAELLPVDPGCVVPKLNSSWEPVYQVTFPDGSTDVLTQEDIWHVRTLTLDGLVGLNPIAYAREAISLAAATEEHGARLFSNGAVTSGVLRTEQTLSDQAYERLKKDFEERHTGLGNAHRPMILEMGLDWKSMALNAEDSQFLETRKFQLEEICRLFRVPLHMVQNTDRATFNNTGDDFMDVTNDDYIHLLSALLPPGPAWSASDPAIAGAAPSLTRVHQRADALMRELDPRTTTELINRWERLCGLPDECIPAGTQTLRQRQQRLDAKVNLAGGINEDFYLAQLAALGRPDATITRYDKSTFTCSSACTDAVNAPEWRYYWQVNMPAATNTTWMTCGDPCDSALRIWGDTVVECVLNKLCPSHTYVIFKYPE